MYCWKKSSWKSIALMLIIMVTLMVTGCPESPDIEAESKIVISGRVLSPLGDGTTAVSGVTVSVDNRTNETDSEGNFSLEVPPNIGMVELELSKDSYVFPTPTIEVASEHVTLEAPIPAVSENFITDDSVHIIMAIEEDQGLWKARRESSDVIVDSDNASTCPWISEVVDEEHGLISITLEHTTDELYKFYLTQVPDSQAVTAYVFTSGDPAQVFELSMPEHTIIDPDWDLFWIEEHAIHVVDQIEPHGVRMVGDLGPSGGTIIFDKGIRDTSVWALDPDSDVIQDPRFEPHDSITSTNEWRYLEVAPQDMLHGDPPAEITPGWGLVEPDPLDGTIRFASLDTGRMLGQGKENTEIINSHYAGKEHADELAAYLCASYDEGGTTDWFLPSIEELIVLYDYLSNDGGTLHYGPEIDDLSYRWSSSQYLPTGTYAETEPNEVFSIHYIFDGSYRWPSRDKDQTALVRPMRRF